MTGTTGIDVLKERRHSVENVKIKGTTIRHVEAKPESRHPETAHMQREPGQYLRTREAELQVKAEVTAEGRATEGERETGHRLLQHPTQPEQGPSALPGTLTQNQKRGDLAPGLGPQLRAPADTDTLQTQRE